MDATSIRRYIVQTFAGVEVIDGTGGVFFFYGAEHKFPFATLTTSDEYDQASNLSRPDVFRLNVGVSKATFQALFTEADKQETHDFTALDRLMPHPVYGKMHWVCVLNPSAATFPKARELLAEAYEMAAGKRASQRL